MNGVHVFWPFWIQKTLKIHPNGYCNFKVDHGIFGRHISEYVLTIVQIQIQIQILYCINNLQSQEDGAIMTEAGNW